MEKTNKVNLKVLDNVVLTVRDVKTGEILETRRFKNLFTTAGLTHLLKLLIGESASTAVYCGVGTGVTAVNIANTALEAEIGRVSLTSYTRTALVATLVYFFGGGDCNGTWTEEGLLTASAAGTLVTHTLFGAPVVKTSSKTVTLSHTLTFAFGA
jgi:hypothetical protein